MSLGQEEKTSKPRTPLAVDTPSQNENLLRAGHEPCTVTLDAYLSSSRNVMAAAASRALLQLARRDALSLTVSAFQPSAVGLLVQQSQR